MAVPKKKTSQIAPQYAPVASPFGGRQLCRMLELRRDEASASRLQGLRPLWRARGPGGRGRNGLTAAARGPARVSDRLVVALDAMGGDKAPDTVIKGASDRPRAFPANPIPSVRRREPARAADREAADPQRLRDHPPHRRVTSPATPSRRPRCVRAGNPRCASRSTPSRRARRNAWSRPAIPAR